MCTCVLIVIMKCIIHYQSLGVACTEGLFLERGGVTNIKYLSLAFISKLCTLASYKITIYPLFLILL